MVTKFLQAFGPDKDNSITEAATILASSGLVAFPTETVYGLGGNALDSTASRRIYEAKGRPSDNPLIVHISQFSQLESIALNLPKEAKILADAFWPGPLTMVVKKNDIVPLATTGGLDTVAVRMPNHPVALELINRSGCMIAAPSANLSGRPSPTKAEHVREDLDGKIDCILDGGSVDIGLESTIIDLTDVKPMILRPGYINADMLSKVLGYEVGTDPAIMADAPGATGLKPKAPGMRYKHYAPKADLTVVTGEETAVVLAINRYVDEAKKKGIKTGVIATRSTESRYVADHVLVIGDRDDEDSIARHLYDILRQFDDLGVEVIYSEEFSTPRIGQAIMNRLLKAAGHTVINI